MAKYRGWAELEEASYLSDLFQHIVADCRVSSNNRHSDTARTALAFARF